MLAESVVAELVDHHGETNQLEFVAVTFVLRRWGVRDREISTLRIYILIMVKLANSCVQHRGGTSVAARVTVNGPDWPQSSVAERHPRCSVVLQSSLRLSKAIRLSQMNTFRLSELLWYLDITDVPAGCYALRSRFNDDCPGRGNARQTRIWIKAMTALEVRYDIKVCFSLSQTSLRCREIFKIQAPHLQSNVSPIAESRKCHHTLPAQPPSCS